MLFGLVQYMYMIFGRLVCVFGGLRPHAHPCTRLCGRYNNLLQCMYFLDSLANILVTVTGGRRPLPRKPAPGTDWLFCKTVLVFCAYCSVAFMTSLKLLAQISIS